MKIRIKEKFKADYITRAAGEKLRNLIVTNELTSQKIEIDFSGVEVASTSFFDEAFAKLAEHGWDENKIKNKVVLLNLGEHDRAVLLKVCNYRGLDLRKI